MSWKVRVITPTKFPKVHLDFVANLADKQLREMAVQTTDTMKNKIHGAIKRAESTGNLEESITFERFLDGYGIGNISFMNQIVPYWRHVNFGSVAIGANWQHRVPVGGFNPGFDRPIAGRSDQRWFVAQGGSTFIPKVPIAPLNYIENTLVEVPRIINTVLRTVR